MKLSQSAFIIALASGTCNSGDPQDDNSQKQNRAFADPVQDENSQEQNPASANEDSGSPPSKEAPPTTVFGPPPGDWVGEKVLCFPDKKKRDKLLNQRHESHKLFQKRCRKGRGIADKGALKEDKIKNLKDCRKKVQEELKIDTKNFKKLEDLNPKVQKCKWNPNKKPDGKPEFAVDCEECKGEREPYVEEEDDPRL